jgi:hypothetical protein
MPAPLSGTEFESETRSFGNPDSVKIQHALDAWLRHVPVSTAEDVRYRPRPCCCYRLDP